MNKAMKAGLFTMLGAIIILLVLPIIVDLAREADASVWINKLAGEGYRAWAADDGDIIFSGDITPNESDMYDIGAADKRWRDLYLSGSSLHLGSNTLSIDNEQFKTDYGSYVASTATATYIVGVNTVDDDVPGSTGYWVKEGATGKIVRSTDDPYADDDIQAAIDSLPAAAMDKGGKVILLEGLYYTNAAITVTNGGITIEGMSDIWATTIRAADGSTHNILEISGDHCNLRNLFINGNKANCPAGGKGIYITGSFPVLENVNVFFCHDSGIEQAGSAGDVQVGLHAFAVNVGNCDDRGWLFNWYTADYWLVDCQGSNCLVGCELREPSTAHLVNCWFDGNTMQGIGMRNDGLTADYGRDVWIDKCHIGSNPVGLAVFTTGAGTIFDRVHIHNSLFVANTDAAISIDPTHGGSTGVMTSISIKDNEFKSNDKDIYFIGGPARFEDGQILGNHHEDTVNPALQLYFTDPETEAKFRIYNKYSDLFMDVLAEDTDHVVTAEDLTAATPITCTLAAQPDVPRNVTITITDANTSITAFQITVAGVDAKGNSVSEVFDQTGGLSQVGSVAFATITSVTVNSITGDDAGDVLDVGIGSKLGLSNIIYATGDVYKVKKNNVDWASANYTVNATYHTVDVSTGGAIVGGDDFTIWYRSNLNIIN